ncbi:molybdopterin-dependent oxidoreductase [Streptomyces rubiginosohelvolus]|uniref:molybdopterin-dependent oxidoreductase n=1 Tax=Streptomyces rubiginosohelvolus TaxID=67362 RepID=UPI0037AA691D
MAGPLLDGYALAPDHGGPRLLVPHLYFWKSAKWVKGLRLTTNGPAVKLGVQTAPGAEVSPYLNDVLPDNAEAEVKGPLGGWSRAVSTVRRSSYDHRDLRSRNFLLWRWVGVTQACADVERGRGLTAEVPVLPPASRPVRSSHRPTAGSWPS